MVDTSHYQVFQTCRQCQESVNANVNYGLWVIMMCLCRCRFFNCNKWTTLVGDVDNGGSYAPVGQGIYR